MKFCLTKLMMKGQESQCCVNLEALYIPDLVNVYVSLLVSIFMK